MTSSTIITDYTGHGTHAARPATPNIPAGATALYYETDTTNTFVWTGSAWTQINGGGFSGPTIVQRAGFASGTNVSTGVTFGTAPTNGNLLLAMVMDFSSSAVNGSGWTGLVNNGASSDGFGFGYKVAGASESTTQTPTTDAANGVVACWEISGGVIGASNFQQRSLSATGGTPIAQTYTATKNNQMFVGAFDLENNQTPTSLTGMAHSSIISASNRTLVIFDTLVSSMGAASVGLTPASTTTFCSGAVPIG